MCMCLCVCESKTAYSLRVSKGILEGRGGGSVFDKRVVCACWVIRLSLTGEGLLLEKRYLCRISFVLFCGSLGLASIPEKFHHGRIGWSSTSLLHLKITKKGCCPSNIT